MPHCLRFCIIKFFFTFVADLAAFPTEMQPIINREV